MSKLQKYIEAEKQRVSGNIDAAVELYREALKLDPNDWKIRECVADALWSKEDREGALRELFSAANRLIWERSFDDAKRLLKKMLDWDPRWESDLTRQVPSCYEEIREAVEGGKPEEAKFEDTRSFLRSLVLNESTGIHVRPLLADEPQEVTLALEDAEDEAPEPEPEPDRDPVFELEDESAVILDDPAPEEASAPAIQLAVSHDYIVTDPDPEELSEVTPAPRAEPPAIDPDIVRNSVLLHVDDGGVIQVTGQSFLIGADAACNHRIAGVAARQTRIVELDGLVFVKDCKSARTTLLNGEPVAVAVIRSGDKISLGPDGPVLGVEIRRVTQA